MVLTDEYLKDHLKILSWLMLLVHLASWALLHVAPLEREHVVFKKECLREAALAKLAAATEKRPEVAAVMATTETGAPQQTKTEIKICTVNLAPPPASVSGPAFPFYIPLEPIAFRQVYYHFLSTSEEPDPPRFA